MNQLIKKLNFKKKNFFKFKKFKKLINKISSYFKIHQNKNKTFLKN